MTTTLKSLSSPTLTRRSVLLTSASVALAALVRAALGPARAAPDSFQLVAAPARVSLLGQPHPETTVWRYNGQVPWPEIRLRQGERVRVVVENHLTEETTVHWHGVRLPNAMDGVPHLTQAPISPGGSFTYEFVVPDAGTFWYHPHQRSFEQVDRDITWVLDDWRLRRKPRSAMPSATRWTRPWPAESATQ